MRRDELLDAIEHHHRIADLARLEAEHEPLEPHVIDAPQVEHAARLAIAAHEHDVVDAIHEHDRSLVDDIAGHLIAQPLRRALDRQRVGGIAQPGLAVLARGLDGIEQLVHARDSAGPRASILRGATSPAPARRATRSAASRLRASARAPGRTPARRRCDTRRPPAAARVCVPGMPQAVDREREQRERHHDHDARRGRRDRRRDRLVSSRRYRPRDRESIAPHRALAVAATSSAATRWRCRIASGSAALTSSPTPARHRSAPARAGGAPRRARSVGAAHGGAGGIVVARLDPGRERGEHCRWITST